MESDQALAGIKVADFSWVITAPMATRYLAQHGATVVKVESATNIDGTRPYAPYKDNIPGVNRGGMFCTYNNSKLSLALDLKNPKAVAIAKRLVKWADIVVESFSPGKMNTLGLGYEELRKIRPDMIMVSTSMFGQEGPNASYSAMGTMLQGTVGFVNSWGWPDRPPVAPQTAYTDFVVPSFIVVAIIAALEQRLKTGEGQFIDVSQYEAALQFMSPAILDYTANGIVQSRNGNRSAYSAPKGIYPCCGEDRWCAIEVRNDHEWENFCEAIGHLAWTQDPHFGSVTDRMTNVEELDKRVGEWTSTLSPEQAMERLQAHGVPAMRVANNRDLCEDPQLNSMGYYQVLEHPEMGEVTHDKPPFVLSETPCKLSPAPCLGQHTEHVCTKLLGMSDEEFLELTEEGIFV